jgi:hypothetical protein
MLRNGRRRTALATGLALAGLVATACTGDGGGSTPTPHARSAAASPDWVVTLGDSYISGEGARWGANGPGAGKGADALGPDAYFDKAGQESEPGCHRASRTIVMPRLAGLRGENLACSGATTRSDSSGVRFKPGIDFAHETDGDGIGQALALRRFAATHRVEAVVVSIGGNDFGFGALAGRCVTNNLQYAGGAPDLCSDDSDLESRFAAPSRARVQAAVGDALDRVVVAMRQAGYEPDAYRRIVLTYPSPIASADRLRGTDASRASLGCPIFAQDADWADQVALPAIDGTVRKAAEDVQAPYEVLDLSTAFDGHRLCETGTSRLPETGLARWDAPGAVDRVEWVNQVYTTVAPHQVQESLHPNYWGTAAERACLRLVLAGSAESPYRCENSGPGLHDGDPVMQLVD